MELSGKGKKLKDSHKNLISEAIRFEIFNQKRPYLVIDNVESAFTSPDLYAAQKLHKNAN